jgi:hypothetical protein
MAEPVESPAGLAFEGAELVSVAVAAERLGVSLDTVKRRLQRGEPVGRQQRDRQLRDATAIDGVARVGMLAAWEQGQPAAAGDGFTHAFLDAWWNGGSGLIADVNELALDVGEPERRPMIRYRGARDTGAGTRTGPAPGTVTAPPPRPPAAPIAPRSPVAPGAR